MELQQWVDKKLGVTAGVKVFDMDGAYHLFELPSKAEALRILHTNQWSEGKPVYLDWWSPTGCCHRSQKMLLEVWPPHSRLHQLVSEQVFPYHLFDGIPPRRRGPHGAAVPAPNENRGEIERLRRQVVMLTHRLAQLEAPTQEDDTFDTEDFFKNPFHNQAQPRQQKRSSFHAGNAHDNRQRASQRSDQGTQGVRQNAQRSDQHNMTFRTSQAQNTPPANRFTGAGTTQQQRRYGVGSRCYKCGKPGHTSADCRKASTGRFDSGRQLLVEEEPESGAELEIQPVYDEGIDEIEEEDILYG
ncbi:hypothetical protein F0562_003695 [Nyssa sinensis]|uniref:CCHC-type domain-containing protein n=1 Tax=Nyssa sinensis TaxID=561372 RepID=A0A5J5C0L3_9ASTE|nr:hypothetical protein F0562_003695 [Nyssa sinensis]